MHQLIPRLPISPAARIVVETAERIGPAALSALLRHECGAVVVRGFLSKEATKTAVELILKASAPRTNWLISQGDGQLVESDVDTIGTPLNVAKAKGREAVDRYYVEALDTSRLFRAVDLLGPLDKLRLELDEAHPFGCVLGRDETTRSPRAAGLVRIMQRSSSRGLVHMDDVDVVSPDRGVFSANVYLQNAASGGELEIWPVTLSSEKDLMDNAAAVGLLTSSSGDPLAQRALRDSVLPNPPVVIAPQPGDLVLLSVQRPHAVKGPIHGARPRVSVQTFVTHRGVNMPLEVEV